MFSKLKIIFFIKIVLKIPFQVYLGVLFDTLFQNWFQIKGKKDEC